MLTPSSNLKASRDQPGVCEFCRRPTAWTYSDGTRRVYACRPDHAEQALRGAGAKTA